MGIDNDQVNSWMKRVYPDSDFANNFIADVQVSGAYRFPIVVALFYNVDSWKQRIQTTRQHTFHRLNIEDAKELRSHLVDMIVLDGIDPVRASVIEALNPDWRLHHFKWISGDHVVTLDGINYYMEKKLSINRCRNHAKQSTANSMSAYQTQSWKQGRPSPGKQNDCESPTWLSEDNLYSTNDDERMQFEDGMTQLRSETIQGIRGESEFLGDEMHPMELDEEGADCGRTVIHDVGPDETCDEPILDQEREYEEEDLINEDDAECEDGDGDENGNNEESIASLEQSITRAVDRLGATFGQPVQTPWDMQKKYKPEDIEHMRKYYPGKMPWKSLRLNLDKQAWFHYVIDAVDQTLAHYGCWVCQIFYDVIRLAPRYKSDFAKYPGNKISNQHSYNWLKVDRHHKSKDHKTCYKYFLDEYANKLPRLFTDEQLRQDAENNGFFKAQNGFFRNCFTAAKLYLSFEAHPALLTLEKMNGLNMGTHFRDAAYAQKGQMFISQMMHENLVKYLKDEQPPVGLMIDESTDLSQHKYLVVLLQAPEKNIATVYFYKLLKIGSDETAPGIFNIVFISPFPSSRRLCDTRVLTGAQLRAIGRSHATLTLARV